MNQFSIVIDYEPELETLRIVGGYADSCEYDEVRTINDVNECLTDFLNGRK